MKSPPRFKQIILIFFFFCLGITVLILLGTLCTPTLPYQPLPQTIPTMIPQVVDYLSKKEHALQPKKGTEKKIFFPPSGMGRKPLSIVYFHGFSASRAEASPIFETLASQSNSPLFMTRFYGHGLGAEELGAAQIKNWIDDALEAYQIAQTLGEKMILTCMSTGCALALYLAYYYPQKIKALVFLSPNFSPVDRRAFLAIGPFGPLLTRLIIGDYRTIHPTNEGNRNFWTIHYGSAVIPEMVGLVFAIKKLDLSKILIPVLTLYTPFDTVVSAEEIVKNIPRLGSQKNKLIAFPETKEHVLAGNIMNPTMNEKVLQQIQQFLKDL